MQNYRTAQSSMGYTKDAAGIIRTRISEALSESAVYPDDSGRLYNTNLLEILSQGRN